MMATHFFNHTQNWINGEILEGVLVAIFGGVTITLGFLFWQLGKSPVAKSLLIPMMVCGLIYTGIGLSLYFSNKNLAEQYHKEYIENSQQFVVKEKERVENFQYMYTISKVVAMITFIATIFIFWITKSSTWQAVGLSLSYFGLAGLVVDFFSQHRSFEYYDAIRKALESL